jgi:uncharacterized protein YukE
MSSIVIIPPMPRGDPQGMRELAGVCKSVAGQLGSIGDEVTGLPKGMTFEGSAADQFTGRMASIGSRTSNAAEELQSYIGRLESAAAEVERQIAEREQAIRRAEAEHAAMKVMW